MGIARAEHRLGPGESVGSGRPARSPRAMRLKEGRVISSENADHLAAVRDCLRRLRAVHADLANKADELAEIDTARRTVLARMQALGKKCQSHLLALAGEDNAELGAEAE